jgi:proline racemase
MALPAGDAKRDRVLRIPVIDSHTGGEPTRVVPQGGIDLQGATMLERREHFRRYFDHLRRGILCEPRGSDVLVGAALTPPVNPGSAAGVVFFNNAGYLGMCGHGTIGVIETLRHQGRLEQEAIALDTPAGTVLASLTDDGIAVRNVPARRSQRGLELDVPGYGIYTGDVAYGGNWFFIVRAPEIPLCLSQAMELTEVCLRIRRTLTTCGICGDDGSAIDHVELSGPATALGADSKNFVLCPGAAYDRSPCGTGTSAKLVCLVEDGALEPGAWYEQESITGSTFRGKIERVGHEWVPTIVGRASITAETTLLFHPDDPFQWGIE